MALHKQVQGVGDRGGIFWAGRPTTMLALDDSIVLVQVGAVASILGAQGAVGALVQGARQMRKAKAIDAAGDDMTGEEFKDQKGARVISWDDVTSARLDGKKRSRKLTLSANGNEAHLRYAAKLWPDDDATAFFGAHLGDRFTNSVETA
jgi:hypothetical protein